MEAEVLRVILLVAGVCLILGIYLWDRYKRTHRRRQVLGGDDSRHHADPNDREQPLSEEWRDEPANLDSELKALDAMVSESRGGAPFLR